MKDREKLVEETKEAIKQTCAAMAESRAKLENLQTANLELLEKLSGLLIYTREVINKFKEEEPYGDS